MCCRRSAGSSSHTLQVQSLARKKRKEEEDAMFEQGEKIDRGRRRKEEGGTTAATKRRGSLVGGLSPHTHTMLTCTFALFSSSSSSVRVGFFMGNHVILRAHVEQDLEYCSERVFYCSDLEGVEERGTAAD